MTAACRLDRRSLPQADCEAKMCLACARKDCEIYETRRSTQYGEVMDFGGIFREACLDYVPEAKINDYMCDHVGFATQFMSEQEAMG